MNQILCILGQTATGKTAQAYKLAKHKGGELINCDSRQIYKHLDIITGKTDNPTDIPVHMVSVADPKKRFSSFEYAQITYPLVRDIEIRGRVPIVVGGSGLYARSLLGFSPSILPKTTSSDISFTYYDEHIYLKDLDGKDVHTLTRIFAYLNPDWTETLNQSDRQNPRRLVRAIQKQVTKDSGFLDTNSLDTLANTHTVDTIVLLHADDNIAEERISKRVLYRIDLGALDECKKLQELGYTASDPGLQTLGYQSVFRYLAGDMSMDAMIGEWITKEKQYAKRQKQYLQKYFPKAKIRYV